MVIVIRDTGVFEALRDCAAKGVPPVNRRVRYVPYCGKFAGAAVHFRSMDGVRE